jgi:hypothetical protein
MRRGTNGRLTLGDLIVAVTDEVSSFIDDPATRYRIVALIVSDLVSRGRVRLGERSREFLAEEDGRADELSRRFG